MTKLRSNLTLRQARRDDISAILAWLNAPAFLAATRVTRMSEMEMAEGRKALQTMLDRNQCFVAVHDNIRIAAIICKNHEAVDSDRCPVWFIPRLRLDWVTRMDEVLDEARRISGNSRKHSFEPELAPLVSESTDIVVEKAIKFRVTGQRALVLGPEERSKIPIDALRSNGYEVRLGSHHDEIYTKGPYDLIVCSGYHLRIPQSICDAFTGRIINIHAGCLPWARGIGLTLFAALLGYPLGTSIHLIDSGLDTGDLLLESRMSYKPDDTLRTLYSRMLSEVNHLFVRFLNQLSLGNATQVPQQQINPRTFARTRTEFETVLEICPNGYDTQINEIRLLAIAMQAIVAFRNHLALSDSERSKGL